MSKNLRFLLATSMAVVPALSACGGETGTLQVSVSGEEAATDGYPVPDGPAFVDGWSLEFDALVVSLAAFELHGADGASIDPGVEPVLVDLTGGDRVLYELPGIEARRWEDVRYVIRPATAESVDEGAVDAAIRARMIAEGLSIYVAATATRGAETRTLEYTFDLDILNERCIAGDGTDGVVVPAGAVAQGQITLHWDHLFLDTLRLDEAEMRFDAMAAAANAEGHITLESLNAQRLANLVGLDGEPLVDGEGEPVAYDPASAALPEPTLMHMVRAATVTVGHWNGEGHCEYVER